MSEAEAEVLVYRAKDDMSGTEILTSLLLLEL